MSNASKLSVGRALILVAVAASVIVPFVIDMITQAALHMENPLWLPHAKLHAAMSVHSAIALGLGAVAVLAARWKRPEVVDLAIAAFLATAFWISLLTAGLWPGAGYSPANFAADADPIVVIGEVPIEGNVFMAVLTVVIGWAGFALAASGLDRQIARPAEPEFALR